MSVPLILWSDELGKYGEPKGFVTKGIEHNHVSYLTRIHTWTIEVRKQPPASDNRITLELENLGDCEEQVSTGALISSNQFKAPSHKDLHPLEYCQ